jgi:hypothetical protein
VVELNYEGIIQLFLTRFFLKLLLLFPSKNFIPARLIAADLDLRTSQTFNWANTKTQSTRYVAEINLVQANRDQLENHAQGISGRN